MSYIRPVYIGFLLAGLLFLAASGTATAQNINWHSFEDAVTIAQKNDRPIVVDVWAPWCGWCHKMKKQTYPKLPNSVASEFVFTRLNRDDTRTKHQYKGQKLSSLKLAQEIRAQSVPTVVILTADGNYLLHVSGFLNAEKLQSILLKTQQFTSRQ